MDTLTALITRTSTPKLGDPAPSREHIDTMLRAAVRAPDHGKLKPWEFLVVEGDARVRLGEVMAEALLAREPEAPPQLVEKERTKCCRAPTILVVVAKVTPDHPKIPVVEQVLSAGCAAQNIHLAAHHMGYGCIWRTGAPARDPKVKAALGLAEIDEIVGFMYLGTAQAEMPVREIDAAEHTRVWP